jgi:hypothetical protein
MIDRLDVAGCIKRTGDPWTALTGPGLATAIISFLDERC